jgi:hypothetical protein
VGAAKITALIEEERSKSAAFAPNFVRLIRF